MPSLGPARADGRAVQGPALAIRPALGLELIGLALLIAGFAAAGPTVAVPGAALCVLAILAMIWVRVISTRLRLEARAPSTTIIDGEPLTIEITISGPRLLKHAGAMLHHDLLREPVLIAEAGRFAVTARAHGRGYLRVPPPRVELSDPFGLARATRPAHSSVGTLLVLPRTEPVHWLTGAEDPALEGPADGRIGGPTTIDLVGLREYQPGTPATRIHWPALARGGDLLERVFANENQPAPMVAVDPRIPAGAEDPALLDVVIRAAASLALELARRGNVDLLLPGQASPLRITAALTTWPGALRALALLAPAPRNAAAPRIPVGSDGVLYYACVDRAMMAVAQNRWKGRLLSLGPETPETIQAAGPVSGAVLEVAGCVGRPLRGWV